MALTGCGRTRYQLNFDGYGFESKRTSYAQGDEVSVYYGMIATDTDYNFSIDEDVSMEQTFDNQHGYVFTFTMPDHDVTMHVESRNSMEYDPGVHLTETPENLADEIKAENMSFDYYEKTVATDGGDGYEEFVLYDRDEGDGMILAKYVKEEGADETMEVCLVPFDTWVSCMNIVRLYGMADWEKGPGADGKYCVAKFNNGKGEPVRVTSEDMPEDGRSAFDALANTLGTAWNQHYPSRNQR